jgi:hypothetical protein
MDELNSRARSLLDAACAGDDPSAEDAHRVRHAVLLRVGAVGVGTAALTTSAAQAKGILGTIAAKVGAALFVVGGTATVGYYATQPEPQPLAAVVVPAAQAPKKAAPSVQRAEGPSAALRVEDLPVEAEESPKRAGAPRVAARAVEPTDAAPAKPNQDLDAEMKLIRAADAALRGGRSSEALSLLAQHSEQHPSGLLVQEREGLSLLARCQSGGRAAVQAAAERYLARAPRSPLAPRLRSACGIDR